MKPLVSVRVLTYQHEKYIAQCLESILMQKTNFPYEIIVGEDCGADRTREILLEYKENYPDKIKLVLPEENTGGYPLVTEIVKISQGKYIAMCDGDDYWIDPLKLQKQVDIMEANPEISLTFHNAFVLNEAQYASRVMIEEPLGEFLSLDEVVHTTAPASSLMLRKNIAETLPEWRYGLWCGDYVVRLWAAAAGKHRYLSDIMSVYRLHNKGLNLSSTKERKINDTIFACNKMDEETNHQYTESLQRKISEKNAQLAQRKDGAIRLLLKPQKILAKLRRYKAWIKQQRDLYAG